MHHKFLDKHPDADERKRRRRLQFVEMPGLETALWPVLFYDDELCLTNVRATDTRRLARKEESDSSDDEGDASRHSTKRAYGAPGVGFSDWLRLLLRASATLPTT